jgi:hypothetical protein
MGYKGKSDKEYQHEYYLKNKDGNAEKHRKYYEKNKEKILHYNEEYIKRNIKYFEEYRRNYYINKKTTIEFKKIIISEKKRYKDILIYNIRKNAPKKSI